MKNLQNIKYIVLDVDGTLTDSGIYYDENGNETKKFSTKDAAGFFAAYYVGIKIVVLTGRECAATTKRMSEMKVSFVGQNIGNKAEFLQKFMDENFITKDETAYIGDDLNDILAMNLTGFVGCPADSCCEVIALADYVSKVNGGHGAVRDIIEYILNAREEWSSAIGNVFGVGV